MPVKEYFSSLSDNPYFGAGFGLAGLGIGMAALRKGFQFATVLFHRYYMITLEVPSRDSSFGWLLQWISVNATKTQHLSVETIVKQHDTGRITTHLDFVPSPGNHYFWSVILTPHHVYIVVCMYKWVYTRARNFYY